MGDPVDVRSGTTKLDAVKIAIDRLLAQLDEDDRISIVAFNRDSQLLLSPTPGDDLAGACPRRASARQHSRQGKIIARCHNR